MAVMKVKKTGALTLSHEEAAALRSTSHGQPVGGGITTIDGKLMVNCPRQKTASKHVMKANDHIINPDSLFLSRICEHRLIRIRDKHTCKDVW